MALPIKDGAGADKSLKTSTDGSDLVPHHIAEGAVLGAVDETAPGSDTASSGLNGRLQRIAQRLSTLIGYFKAEDAAHTSADLGIMALGVRKDTAAASSGTTGDYEPLSLTSNGSLRAHIESTTAITPGTAPANLGKAEDAAHATGDVGVMALAVRRDTAAASSGTTGDYEPLQTNSTGSLRVHHEAALPTGSNTIGNIGTIATSVTPGTGPAHLGKAEDAAHASGDVGVMALAVRRDADTSLVGTDGDYAPLQVNATGAAKVADAAVLAAVQEGTVPLSALVSGSVSNTDGASTAVIAAQGSGVQTYLTDMTITNSSDTGVLVEIKDGSSTKWSAFVPAKGGITHRFASPLVGTANTAWNVDAASATTTIYASFSGFQVSS